MAVVPNGDGQGIKANGFIGVSTGWGQYDPGFGNVDFSYEAPTMWAATIPAWGLPPAYISQVYLNNATGILYTAISLDGVWVEK